MRVHCEAATACLIGLALTLPVPGLWGQSARVEQVSVFVGEEIELRPGAIVRVLNLDPEVVQAFLHVPSSEWFEARDQSEGETILLEVA